MPDLWVGVRVRVGGRVRVRANESPDLGTKKDGAMWAWS